MSDQLEQLLVLWQPLLVEMSQANALEKPLLNLLNELNNLLFLQQNTLAKWRGHLRVSQDYFSYLVTQQAFLKTHLSENTLPAVKAVNLIPEKIKQLTKPYFILTTQDYRVTTLIVFIMLIGFVWLLVIRLQKKVKVYGEQSVALFKMLLVNKPVTAPDYLSKENKDIALLISEVVQPEHNEYDYQNITDKLLHLQQLLFQQSKSAIWQLSTTEKGLNNHFALLLLQNKGLNKGSKQELDDIETKALSWRSLFDQQTKETLIACAKTALIRKASSQCIITVESGTFIVTMLREQTGWVGTLSRADEQQLLTDNVSQLEQALVQLSENNQDSIIENSETLSQMLIRTMLQSQSVSIGSGETSTQVYRQLTRIFDWCRQVQINTALMSQGNSAVLSNVNLRNELHGLTYNMMVEANQQRNRVYLHIDEQLLSKGKMNTRLFHRTLKSFMRAILVEQFNARLLLKVDVVDKNSGQQIIRFSFHLSSDKKIKSLPEVINKLIPIEEKNLAKAPQIIRYLQTLLAHTHSTNLQAAVAEQGLQLSIDMPIAIAEVSSSTSHQQIDSVDFKQANMILLSQDKQCSHLITEQVTKANGKLEHLTKVEHFIRQVNAKHLTRRALSVVMVTSDLFNTSYEKIQQHIHSLPKGLQPKLMVLQSAFDQKHHKYGFFAHMDSSVENVFFKQQLKVFIDSSSANNLLIQPEIFNQHRFAQSQVEILVGIEQPQKQQQLLRLLHWLGLQVQVISHQQSLLKHWQSGRYLLLITEFDSSPYVELDVGKNIQRSIFTFNEKIFEKKNSVITKLTKNWSQVCLPNLLDIDALVKTFTPWLKTRHLALAKPKSVSHKPSSTEKHDVDNIAALDLTPTEHSIENEGVFDLLAYAQNQGSPELAVIMLDDYLNDINQSVDVIAIAIDNQKVSDALTEVQKVAVISQTMAAADLQLICQELKTLLTAKQFEQAKLKHQQLSLEQERMTLFAQAI
jgi:hypothetical protein